MKLGIVDLDTSHPESWIPLEREFGHRIVGIYDGGSVHPKEYVQAFARKHDVPRVYESLDDLANDVDCAVIHGCDWDTHVAKAEPFVRAGKAVLMDKPLAGNPDDLSKLQQWADQGVRITGGSPLRYTYEAQKWLAEPVEQRGTPHTAFAGCGVDEFNYGIHAFALLSSFLGPGIRSVRHLGQHVQRRVQVDWADGKTGFVTIGQMKWLPTYATIVTDRAVSYHEPVPGLLYRALLERVLPYLAGEAPASMPFKELIEPELTAIAALRSWQQGDRVVTLAELSGKDGFDGPVFAEGYRRAKYPPAAASS